MTLNGLGELVTAVGLGALLWGEWKDRSIVRAIGKPVASAGFIVAAIGFGALESRYGSIVLTGLILGAVGDVCLLGSGKGAFIAGLVSFLLGHVAYVIAFSSLPMSGPQAFIAAVAMAAIMVFIARWVFPHAPDMRIPIGVYMLVIAAMCVVAIGAGAAGAPWMIPVGAVMFTTSDIAVVRDRFVSPGFVNRLWGLPLYYAAQLIIAWSIKAVAG
ncbi:MAG: lysoplasmalogenase [Myxococcales bacterium]|nr:lysoplasmalogenase [Myxococcales bacterium]MDH3484574.1 lysoplasmalogenase [Myxococcales bacterium]